MSASDTIEFAGFRLDGRGGAFRLDPKGEAIPIAIGLRALNVLSVLAARPGDVVLKREIMDAVWPDTTVEDKNLAVQISTLRQILEREGGKSAWIQTVPGRGYRFMAPAAEGDEKLPVSEELVIAPPTRRRWTALVLMPSLAVIAAVGLITGGLGWAGLGRQKPPLAYSPQDRRQSIIVLPFENNGEITAADSAAAGITRTVTDLLAQDSTAPIVPAATAAAYLGKTFNLSAIGREHDVHFVLTGNARRQDGQLTVAATLYETFNGRQLWSQRFEQPDSSDARVRIAYRIRSSIDQATMDEDAARAMREHPGKLDKRDLMFAAMSSTLSQSTQANLLTQIALIERAIALDPNYVWALRENARKHANLVTGSFSSNPEHDLQVATQSVDRALVLAPDDFWVLREKAVVLRAHGKWREAATVNRRLIERQPLSAYRHQELGANLMNLGSHKEALEEFRTARRLAVSSTSDSVNLIDASIANALLATGEFQEAIEQARFAIQEFTPENGRVGEVPWLVLIAAESAIGQDAEARADMRAFFANSRTWRTIATVLQAPSLGANPNLIDGLRRAGMAEE